MSNKVAKVIIINKFLLLLSDGQLPISVLLSSFIVAQRFFFFFFSATTVILLTVILNLRHNQHVHVQLMLDPSTSLFLEYVPFLLPSIYTVYTKHTLLELSVGTSVGWLAWFMFI